SQISQSEPVLHVSKSARDALREKVRHSKYGRVVPVWLFEPGSMHDDEITLRDQSRWRRYADRVLYAALHYKADNGPTLDGASDTKYWADYVRLNRLFADQILAEYKPGDIVWIHDYQLFLLPGMLRAKVPNIYIGYYIHSPFPSSELIRCLSKRKDLLTGVLGSNMIGFQSFSYSRHFTSCCTRILGFESNPAGIDAYGAHVAVDVFPIGIDVKHVQHMAFEDSETQRTVEEMKRIYRGKRIIIGRDRLDSARGVTQKLQAFETFLTQYPEWIGKVVLIQVTSPTSNDEEKEEAKLSTQISHLVSRINGKFGSLSFSPVQHYPQYLASSEYFALLRVADVGLITSVRDGMNTTSLEYVIAQQNNHGPLILSEFSGTAASLSPAIHINPWSFSGTAAAINAALKMSTEERKAQHEQLYKLVTNNPITTWTDNFLDRLLTNLTSFDQSIATPALDPSKLLHQYRRAKRRLFMFDYDGTLTPIVKDPSAAIPSDRVLRTIKTLAADPHNAVWIISGRDQAFLDEWMGHISELGLSAEHGCFIRQPNSDDWENLTEQADMRWQDEVMEIFTHFTERTQGSFIERKRVALTWHHRRVDPEYAVFQAAECRKLLENTVAKKWPVEVMVGKANLEVRPTFVNKGFIAQRLLDEYKRYHDGTGSPDVPGPDFVLCLGDDFTDEDMFRTLRYCGLPDETIFSVTVGASSKQTIAKYHLLEPADVIATIAMLNQNANVPEEELEETLCEVKPNDTATDAPSQTRAEGLTDVETAKAK
ncbi:succinate semialdehyde dehydrogenase NADP+ linked, partial [Ascosphaera pollenicola]